MPLLTKSKYLTGLQCSKYLWITFNDKSKIPPADVATQFIFDQGHEVGDFAKKLYPEGVDVPYNDFRDSITRTQALLSERKPFFEASISAENLYSRVDILNPVDGDEWDIIEVKSSTQVKDVNVLDVAYQKYCCEKFGLKIRKCYLAHLNNEYVRQGDIDVNELFTIEDISGQVDVVYGEIAEKVDEILKTVDQKKCPEVSIGMHCLEPYECPLKEQCWSFLPERSVFNLYWLGKKKKFELLEQGCKIIEDIPIHYKLTDKQRIQKQAIQQNDTYIDQGEIQAFLKTLQHPLYYLDFETYNPAIPLYDGTRPYQRIVFQYSLHIVREENKQAEHLSFLADGSSDPRLEFLTSLKAVIGDTGSVVVFNQVFEEGVLKELAAVFPEHEGWIRNVIGRMVDLLDPFRAFHYYHPDQNGSASLKSVLPALVGKGYEGMNISKGDEASRTFVNIFLKEAPEEQRQKVKKDLEDYCCLDTQAMIDIVNKLQEISCKA